MALEILEGDGVIVTRPDRESLLAIRRGARPYDALIEEAQANVRRIRNAALTSSLPSSPDEDAIEALGVAIVEDVLTTRSP